jgi:hypothetical protein
MSEILLDVEARRMAQVRSAAGPLQHHFNILDPRQSAGNTGETAAWSLRFVMPGPRVTIPKNANDS